MKIGLFGINNGPCAFPKCAAAVARAAEDAGFEACGRRACRYCPTRRRRRLRWRPTTQCSILRSRRRSSRLIRRRFGLALGIIIWPQRDPVVLARALSPRPTCCRTAADFRNRRRILTPEFDAIGAPFDHKGARSEEWLRGDDCAVVDAEAGVQWQMDLVQGRQRDAAAGAAAASRDRVRRAYQGGVQPGRRASRRDGTDLRRTSTGPRSASRDCGKHARQRTGASRMWR